MLSTGTRASGRLDEILRIEKDLVFAIIDQLGVRLSETEREEIQKLPTRSSLAFTAFCRGLDFSDRMDFASARQAFKEAVRLDPNFKEAKSELEKIEITPLNDLQFQRLAALDPLETPAQQHLESTAGVFAGVQQSNPATVPLLQTTGILTVTGDLPVGSK